MSHKGKGKYPKEFEVP